MIKVNYIFVQKLLGFFIPDMAHRNAKTPLLELNFLIHMQFVYMHFREEVWT